jgi:hypothetical protein
MDAVTKDGIGLPGTHSCGADDGAICRFGVPPGWLSRFAGRVPDSRI